MDDNLSTRECDLLVSSPAKGPNDIRLCIYPPNRKKN